VDLEISIASNVECGLIVLKFVCKFAIIKHEMMNDIMRKLGC